MSPTSVTNAPKRRVARTLRRVGRGAQEPISHGQYRIVCKNLRISSVLRRTSALQRSKSEKRPLTALLQCGQEPSDCRDCRFSAILRAEGGTHRPCAYCINHPLPAQRARCSSTFREYVFRRREPGIGSSPRPLTKAPARGFAPKTAHTPPPAAHSTWPRCCRATCELRCEKPLTRTIAKVPQISFQKQ
jgi:hypothetical protein